MPESLKYAPITEEDEFFIGEDKILAFPAFDEDDSPLSVPGGWTFEWILRNNPSSEETLIDKNNAAISLYPTQAGSNTGIQVLVDAVDTLALEPGVFFHTLRRTNLGSKSVMAYGPCVLRYAATR